MTDTGPADAYTTVASGNRRRDGGVICWGILVSSS